MTCGDHFTTRLDQADQDLTRVCFGRMIRACMRLARLRLHHSRRDRHMVKKRDGARSRKMVHFLQAKHWGGNTFHTGLDLQAEELGIVP